MTNPGYTHLTLVVDRSGSMAQDRVEAEAGINTLLAEQFALDGELTVTLTQFDDRVETVQRMSGKTFTYELQPRGMTALLDAVGAEVVRTGEDLAGLRGADRPGRVLFVVVTDGQENSSHEYPLERVRDLLRVQKEQFGWEVQFLGAEDAVWQGNALGVRTTKFANTGRGKTAVFESMSASMRVYRDAPQAVGFAMPSEVGND
ncbi:hypothetical protein GCM10022415_29750 [Knoellia locipacati]|uniref:VWFA domain-containing protein n=1 Tax=Knoellia locipacati TaxID=882824 RepID=A0A512T4S2_9MICO|nr:vWA domain-containing protein [Knoellia locipacati]GEQ15214.1 hypothetical protein KLO01_32610 [Knoellia locipacati]